MRWHLSISSMAYYFSLNSPGIPRGSNPVRNVAARGFTAIQNHTYNNAAPGNITLKEY